MNINNSPILIAIWNNGEGYEQIFEPIETAPKRLTDAFSLF